MLPVSQSALSALQAFGTKLNSNANNVANSQSEGFKKTRVTLSDTQPQGVKANVERIDTPGARHYEQTSQGTELVELSNVNFAEEITESKLNTTFYKANLKTLQVADEMTESLLNIKA